ncbi:MULTISPECIES: CBS domain-containing protein [Kordiimonas]|jgi:CBS domain-containing protein|uniref:CBS domain-containing protein n=1 Tax=Kordiimonas lacus TaxID=637679 RepID=A0A1G7ASG4_9PROT|nr:MULTISPECIES: CBS domain-containing protein [Kordiimonas]SDE17808.1 CBS domain-containing protein [Kordiimonas lacus]
MNVGQILSHKGDDIIAMERGCTVMEVAKLLGERRIGAIPIVDGGTICGIMSERDVVRGIAIRGGGVLADDVSTLMTKSVFTCGKDDTVYELMKMMTERRIRHVPVVDGDKLIGMISIGDVVKHRMQQAAAENEALKDYIAQG